MDRRNWFRSALSSVAGFVFGGTALATADDLPEPASRHPRPVFVPPEGWTLHEYRKTPRQEHRALVWAYKGGPDYGHSWNGWFDDAEGRTAAYVDDRNVVWIWRGHELPLVACGELA